MALIVRLSMIMSRIETRFMGEEGKMDYVSPIYNPDFWMPEEATYELHGVSMAGWDDKTNISFGINLYNLIPNYMIGRNSLYNEILYNVGGKILTLNMLEHGVLQAN